MQFSYSQRKLAMNTKSLSVVSAALMDPHDLSSFGPPSPPQEVKDSMIYAVSPSGESCGKSQGTEGVVFREEDVCGDEGRGDGCRCA